MMQFPRRIFIIGSTLWFLPVGWGICQASESSGASLSVASSTMSKFCLLNFCPLRIYECGSCVAVNVSGVHFSICGRHVQITTRFVLGWCRMKVDNGNKKGYKDIRFLRLLGKSDQSLQSSMQCRCTQDESQNWTSCFSRMYRVF